MLLCVCEKHDERMNDCPNFLPSLLRYPFPTTCQIHFLTDCNHVQELFYGERERERGLCLALYPLRGGKLGRKKCSNNNIMGQLDGEARVRERKRERESIMSLVILHYFFTIVLTTMPSLTMRRDLLIVTAILFFILITMGTLWDGDFTSQSTASSSPSAYLLHSGCHTCCALTSHI